MTELFSTLLGTDTVKQIVIWGVVNQLIGTILAPELEDVARAVNRANPSTPLSPADLADSVVRNFLDRATAQDQASQSGTSGDDFTTMVHLAGDAPGPSQLVEAVRRQLIPEQGTGPDAVTFQQGIAEGRLADKWTAMMLALGEVPLAPADAVDAVVEGQIDQATGAAEAYKSGVSADNFQVLVNTRGNPPSVTELLELNRRGLIPLEGVGPDVTSVQQGIYEGATKDKWWQLLAQLGNYVPPPRTITAMVRAGSLTDQQATQYLTDAGLAPDLVAAYIADAHKPSSTTNHAITASQISQLYSDQLITQTQAQAMLQTLGYTADDSAAIMQLAAYNVSKSQLDSAISRVRSLYVARKITRSEAAASLDSLHVAAANATGLLDTWDVEQAASVRVPSEGQVASALYYGVIDQPTAMSMLEAMGYAAHDAWLVLSVRMHSALPGEP